MSSPPPMSRLSNILWLLSLVIMLGMHGPALPVYAQRADGLDLPVLELNQCGTGLADEIHFTLAATGDTFPHQNIQAVGEAQGYDGLFDYVRPFLQAADLAYTNFDGAMLAGSPYTGYPLFNFNPALAPALRNAGIGLVSTANNHILDRGPEGLDATLDVLDAAGILHHGAVRSNASERPPYLPITLTKDGASLTLGFISATWGTNGIPDPYNQIKLLYQGTSYGEQGGVRQSMLDAVARAAAETDLVVVAAHWGFEYQFYPHQSQIEAARVLAAAGADVILGAQSHTLQPVEWITTGDRQTLVIYSLANFLASQGAFQAQYFTATSVIFYVGLAQAADGTVRVTGYRYLPTIHVDGDTRPAPIMPDSNPTVISHVRTIMRDPTGLRQLPADVPPTGLVAVCPPLSFAEDPANPVTGDFVQHYQSLGSLNTRPLNDALAALGLPLGTVTHELAGDCRTSLPVLYTERQRLELHQDTAWPYRVVGTQVGTYAFRQRYPGVEPTPRTDLQAPDAFADSRFRTRYEALGGLAIFGYPISGPLNEDHPETGVPTTVQYFERARFEVTPSTTPGAPLSEQVRIGLLGRELRDHGGVAALCGGGSTVAAVPASVAVVATITPREPGLPAVSGEDVALVGGVLAQIAQGARGWIPLLFLAALILALVAIGTLAFNDWRTYRRRGTRKGYRRRRSAYERFAGRGGSSVANHPPDPEPPLPTRPPQAKRAPIVAAAASDESAPNWLAADTPPPSRRSITPEPTPTPRRTDEDQDDDLLRQLLEQ
ncbi:MAG: CapA family protein [Oscillochloridaceae bacterium umkhey_bin13]